MNKHIGDQKNDILRAKTIYRYVQALDQGDMDGVATVLEAALDDPELSRIIAEINVAYQEEDQLTPLAKGAQLVRDLLRKHLPSAFEANEPNETPLTVGEVAARLQAERRVPPADQEANRELLGSLTPLPTWLSVQVVRRLATELGVTASEHFWRVFRDMAIMLGMGRSHQQSQLAAAREEQRRYGTVHKENSKAGAQADSDKCEE